MIRTILPALAQAVDMISLPNFHHEQRAEFLKEKFQVLFIIFLLCFIVITKKIVF